MKNKVLDIIKARVSCRNYSEKKVSLKKINEIVEAGKMAPSAKNCQIANILVVKSKGWVDKLKSLSMSKLNRDCYYGAPVIILVYAPRDNKFCIQDCSCILENMFIASHALGIDSCWINQSDELLMSDEGIKLKKKLGIPEEAMIVGSCILGYAKEGTPMDIKTRKENFIAYK